MKKSYYVLIAIIISALALTSCAARSASLDYATSEQYDTSKAANEGIMAEAPMAAPAADSATTGGMTNAVVESTTDQMIVKNASLSILADDPLKTQADIMELAADMGGYTVYSNSYQTYTSNGEQVPYASVTIRVPAEKLNDALDAIKEMTGDPAEFVTNESVSGEDVTQAYTDLASRLRNLQEAETELTAMYEKATDAEDVLAIYNQKMSVSEQIEVIKGQMQYYEDASATSSIAVDIAAKASVQPVTIAGWQPKGVARNAVQALINFLKGFVNFLIWLAIYILPILIIIGTPVFFIVRWLVRRNRRIQEKRRQMPPMPGEKK
jgi:hypothetical protein